MNDNSQFNRKIFTLSDLKLKGFKVYEFSGPVQVSASHGRRDFYKIVLATGHMSIFYGDQTFEVKDTFLYFGNPKVSQSVVHHNEPKGYSCLFTEEFIATRDRTDSLQHSPLFRFGEKPIALLGKEQEAFITGLYQKMLSIQMSDYAYKDEMLRSCIELIMHEALRMQPLQNDLPHNSAASRITNRFLELLERQFPIESTSNPLSLKTAQDFAENLSAHVNYLNRSVRAMTGKATSVHIAERIAAEAKALLQHTDWSVADIAFSLGFEYPTYFNTYFKRVTGRTPKYFRNSKV